MKDLGNESCEIILGKLNKYHSSDSVPVRVYVQDLKTFCSMKVSGKSTLKQVLQANFENAFDENGIRSKFSRMVWKYYGVLCLFYAGTTLISVLISI